MNIYLYLKLRETIAKLKAGLKLSIVKTVACFAKAAQQLGLEVSLKKTEVLRQPSPNEPYHPPHTGIKLS